MTKRKLGSHRGQEVIRAHTCAHNHAQKESEQKIKREKTQQTERGWAQKEGMGWTERKVNRGEGNKRRWKEEDGKQGEEEEEIWPNYIRIEKTKNRNP